VGPGGQSGATLNPARPACTLTPALRIGHSRTRPPKPMPAIRGLLTRVPEQALDTKRLRSRDSDRGVGAVARPCDMRVRRGVGCIVVVVAACSGGTGSNASHSIPPSTTPPTASQAEADAGCPTTDTTQVNGRAVPVSAGGSLALANESGGRQSLERDPGGAVLPIKLLWLVKTPPGTMLSLSGRTGAGGAVAWVVDSSGQRSDLLTVSTEAQTAPGASAEWSEVPSLLAVPSIGCYEVTTQVAGVSQTLSIVVT